MQSDPPGNHISEFFPLMWFIFLQLLLRLYNYQKWFHLILLCIGHDPLDTVAHFINFLKKSTFGIYDMFLFRLFEKFRRCRSETLNQIQQCHHGRCHLATLQLGYISFGQFRPVCQFLLGQAIFISQIFNFFSDSAVHIIRLHLSRFHFCQKIFIFSLFL